MSDVPPLQPQDSVAAPAAGPRTSMTPVGVPIQPAADDLQPRDLLHPSAMLPRLGWLARWFARVFFAPVRVPPRYSSDWQALSREGALVVVMGTISLLDYLYFNWLYLREKLPLSRFANGVSLTWTQPWRRALVGWFRRRVLRQPQLPEDQLLRGLLRRREPVTLFLRRGFSLLDLLTPRPQLPYLRELIAAQRELDYPLLIVPQVLVWERDPDRAKSSILDEFFGDFTAPGRIRKLVSFVLNHRRAHVRMADAINLRAFVDEHADVSDDTVLSEQLRLRIVAALQQEDRVVRGAPIKQPDELRREILADPAVREDLQRIAGELGRSLESVLREADQNLNEIAARYRMGMVAAFSFVLTFLWARIYEGLEVDEEGLERVRQAGRTAPVVMVPSHKSHIDYLVISYVFYRHGLIPPHIAAGANLSFFPLGPLFRHAGAFFLRRSFQGQPIYAAVFRHYFRKLLADGHWIEFFPEGGRSRTGKLLPPKFGLIKHVLETVADGLRDDVVLVPTNFGYERLIEEKSYRKELEGGEKKAESPVEVLKATSVLVHKYGRIRIQFGEPMSVRDLLAEHGALAPAAERDSKAFERALKVCGYRILGRINQAAVLTPTALTAAVLLTKAHKGILHQDLLLRVGYLLDLAMRRGAVLSEPLVTAVQVRRQAILEAETRDQARYLEAEGAPDPFGVQSERARVLGAAVAPIVGKALDLFEGARWILRRDFDGETVYIVRSEGRMHLDYYKNNMLHLLVPEALLACATVAKLQSGNEIPPDTLASLTKFLSRLLKFEFVYEPGQSFEDLYTRTLDDFVTAGWLIRRGDGNLVVASLVRGALRLYARLLQSFIESYALMARSLRHLEGGPLPETAFLDRVQIDAQKAFDLGHVECYEAISKVNLTNALQIFREQGFVEARSENHGKKRIKVLAAIHNPEVDAKFASFSAQLHELEAPWTVDQL